MPLRDHVPSVDDRRYDDIVAELRTRIARYTPEWQPTWTDVNDSDPGITLVQLFAWLSEMLLYRMGRVPELNRLKFLELLGIELRPAQPAQAEVSFPVRADHDTAWVTVPPGTQLAAAASDGTPIVFETERVLTALAARLDRLQAFDGYAYGLVSEDNEEASTGFEPFGARAEPDAALLLGFDHASAMPQVELTLAVWVAGEAGGEASYACGAEPARAGPGPLAWEYWNGREWRGANLLEDGTRAFRRSGHIHLKLPAPGEMARAPMGGVEDSRYWLRARIVRDAFERPPRVIAVRSNTVRALQAETIASEVLGASDGRPNQPFTLDNAPVLAGSLRLEVDEGDGFAAWQEVEDFFASAPDDRHFLLNRTSGEIRFGDGRHGRIPVANPLNRTANIVARRYRVGGGRQGNVAATKIDTLLGALSGIEASGIENLRAAHGGRDEERLEEAVLRAPRALRNKGRAVTAEDFESLAAEVGAVRRAKALPLHHPDFPGVRVPGVLTLVLVPDSEAARPAPSEDTKRDVCAFLDARRLLTTELYVVAPRYRAIGVHVELVSVPGADVARVKDAAERALDAYLHPLSGGEDGLGWPFGGDVHFSLVYRRLLEVDGVQRVGTLRIEADGEKVPECSDVALEPDMLVAASTHQVVIAP